MEEVTGKALLIFWELNDFSRYLPALQNCAQPEGILNWLES